MFFFVSEPLVVIEEKAITTLANLCDGDARIALNGLQLAIQSQVAAVKQKAKGHDIEPNSPSSLQQNGECNPLDLSSTDTPGYDEKQIVSVNVSHIKEGLQKTHLLYDRNGEEHYNIISALHKSMRGSDENAALYWLARMLVGGEDPLFVARRLVRFASEDIGMHMADLSCVVVLVVCRQCSSRLDSVIIVLLRSLVSGLDALCSWARHLLSCVLKPSVV